MPDKEGANPKHKKKPVFPWLNGQHRLVVVNDQTFQEEKVWKLNFRNVSLLTAAIFSGIVIFTLLLVKFTPLSRLVSPVPRLSNKELRKEMESLYRDLDSLNRELKGNVSYVESLKKLSTESFEYEKDVKKPEIKAKPETATTFADVPKKSEEARQLVENIQIQPMKENTPKGNLVQAEFLESKPKIDRSVFISPVRGVVSDTFAPARGHYGTDIVAPKGTVIKATKSGTVIMSTWSSDTGHMVGIQHDNNLISWYKHNSANLKKLGDRVSAGEAVAIIGNSGEMTNGPHLHFELWYNGQPVDPQRFVEF